jgi:peptidyl-prolyl cis-trans isomerase C
MMHNSQKGWNSQSMNFRLSSSFQTVSPVTSSQANPNFTPKVASFPAFNTMIATILCLFGVVLGTVSAVDDYNNPRNVEDAIRLAREAAKPWLMRELQMGHTKLPISPATIVCLLVLGVNLCSWIMYQTSGTWAEASHILVKDTSLKTHKALVGMQKEVGGNAKLFGDLAEKYSQCPSSKEKGDLGRFRQGSMAPPFDKAVFDPKSPLKMTIGPIQTQFGYHLIYIRNRKM